MGFPGPPMTVNTSGLRWSIMSQSREQLALGGETTQQLDAFDLIFASSRRFRTIDAPVLLLIESSHKGKHVCLKFAFTPSNSSDANRTRNKWTSGFFRRSDFVGTVCGYLKIWGEQLFFGSWVFYLYLVEHSNNLLPDRIFMNSWWWDSNDCDFLNLRGETQCFSAFDCDFRHQGEG